MITKKSKKGSKETAERTQETLKKFQGKNNVTHITQGDDEVYFADQQTFSQFKQATGCNWFEIDEDNNRLICFADDDEVGNFYLVKSLQEYDEDGLAEMKHSLQFCECWYEEEQRWYSLVCKAGNKRERTNKAVAV